MLRTRLSGGRQALLLRINRILCGLPGLPRFVGPCFVELTYALIDAGVVPILHFDQNWTRDLGRLTELPAKKVIFNPDGMTDVRKFKELVGDRMCLIGDVPATFFTSGTPEDMYNYIRELVRDVGPTGLILAPGCDAPFNTKPENMEAFVAASHECGRVGWCDSSPCLLTHLCRTVYAAVKHPLEDSHLQLTDS